MKIDKIQPYQLLDITTTDKSVKIKRSKLFDDLSKDEKNYLIKKFHTKEHFRIGDTHE